MQQLTKTDRFRKYWSDIALGVTTTIGGMRVTWRHIFQRPVTLVYPEERPQIAVGHRGIHGFEEEKCISCDMCATACPVDCIYIKSVGRGKDAMMTQFDIDYSKCLFCNLCTPPCPTECIWMTQEYDLASYSKEDCTINFARTKSAEEVEAHEEVLKKLDEEKKAKAAAKKAAAAKKKAETEGSDGSPEPQGGAKEAGSEEADKN